MLILNVPFAEKDEAKRLGARWEPNLKKWYAVKQEDYPLFARWLDTRKNCGILCDNIYIAIGKQNCFKCGGETTVIGFGIEKYFNYHEEDDGETISYVIHFVDNNAIHLQKIIIPLPDDFLEKLREQYNFYISPPKLSGTCYPSNHCVHCQTILRANYLFDKPQGPFWVDSQEAAERLEMMRIPLLSDFEFSSGVSFSTAEWLIKEYSPVTVADFSLKPY